MSLLCTAVLILSLSVSAYTDVGHTASGTWTRPGTAACGPSIPFGTLMVVDGRTYICEDRGGLVTDAHLDLWMPDPTAAYTWGRHQKPVYVATCHQAPAGAAVRRVDRLQ